MIGRIQAFPFPLSSQPQPPTTPPVPLPEHPSRYCTPPPLPASQTRPSGTAAPRLHHHLTHPRSCRNAPAALFSDFKPSLHLGCAPGISGCLQGATMRTGSGLGAAGVSCFPALPHHAIIHPSVMENCGFPTSLEGESPCLLHGFISPFPACEPGPTRERDPLLPIVPRGEGTIVILRHCSGGE